MDEKECKCLEIINTRINEIGKSSTPDEPMTEKDFWEMQALLKIYKKIQDMKHNENL